jgi:hypothetical protein
MHAWRIHCLLTDKYDRKSELQDQSLHFEGCGTVEKSPNSLRANANRTAEIVQIASAMSRHDSDAVVPDPTWGRTFVLVHRDVIICSIGNVDSGVPCFGWLQWLLTLGSARHPHILQLFSSSRRQYDLDEITFIELCFDIIHLCQYNTKFLWYTDSQRI